MFCHGEKSIWEKSELIVEGLLREGSLGKKKWARELALDPSILTAVRMQQEKQGREASMGRRWKPKEIKCPTILVGLVLFAAKKMHEKCQLLQS